MTDNQDRKQTRLRVAIWWVCFSTYAKTNTDKVFSGGGIAGLLLAVGLSKHEDIEVSLYEAAESFKEVGAGVTIWGRALTILTRMGLDYDMRVAEGVPTDGLHGISDPSSATIKLLIDFGIVDPTFSFDLRRSDLEEGFHVHSLRLPR